MIPAETCYETHDSELLAIVEAFKTWRHYLEGCKHKVLVLTNHNNIRRFMDIKSLSSRQVCWAQELSRYHFRIDYCQGKVNGAADTLSHFPQRSQDEEKKLRAENTQILYCLQSLLTNASLSGFNTSAELLPLHQVLIYWIIRTASPDTQSDRIWFETPSSTRHLPWSSFGGRH